VSGRALLEALGPILEPARTLRYQPDGDFDDVTTHELELAARALRAISWSCITGAHKLERLVLLRSHEAAS
jgi:hypothetical protein